MKRVAKNAEITRNTKTNLLSRPTIKNTTKKEGILRQLTMNKFMKPMTKILKMNT